MHIIKLDAIDSTNSFLKEKAAENCLNDFTVAIARHQNKGRGQMGTVWQSEPGKNLTFSVFKKVYDLPVEERFYINMAVSLGLYNALKRLAIPGVTIKWPNDILSGDKKICGVLIENFLKNSVIGSAVVGIGLNVNQVSFGELPRVSSLKKITGVHYHLDEVLQCVLEDLKDSLLKLSEKNNLEYFRKTYESKLFRKDKPSTFALPDNTTFPGFIKGVTQEGKLQVLLEDEIIKSFDLKEIRLLY